jgi:hypothetical protein
MRFVRQHRFTLLFMALLVFCSIMVIQRYRAKQNRHTEQHIELREAFILLYTGGYTNDASLLYNRLLRSLEGLSNRELVDDWQRTVIFVEPNANQPDNLIWKYYWTVRKEMEKRSEDSIQKARKLAQEAK